MKYQCINKKASIQDPITVGAVILSIMITIFVMIYVWYAFDTNIRDVVADSPGNATIVDLF